MGEYLTGVVRSNGVVGSNLVGVASGCDLSLSSISCETGIAKNTRCRASAALGS